MFNYVLRRLLYAVPILLGVIALTFLLFNVLVTPEAAAAMAIGSKAPQQAREAWIKSRGLDKPKTEQFVKHVRNLATFEFGTSWKTGRELNEVFRKGAGPSLLITLPGFLAGLIGGVGLALYQVYVRKSLLDRSITLFAVALMSVPTVVYIFFLQAVGALMLNYFPASGFDWRGWETAKFVALPIIVMAIVNLGSDVRLYRTIFMEEINQDYVRTALAKGLSSGVVLGKHVLKNGLIALITLTVATLPRLIMGSLLIENFFGIPGLGNVLVMAIGTSDQPVVMACTYLGSLLYIGGLILTDVCYALADPRIRLGESREVDTAGHFPWWKLLLALLCVWPLWLGLSSFWRGFFAIGGGRFFGQFFSNVWFQNSLVLAGFALLAWTLWSVSHHERWRRAWLRLRADCTGLVALAVVCFYLLLGALELVHFPTENGGTRSVLDGFLRGIKTEKTYSAPLATTLLSSAQPEPLNGRHLLGTDALGKDVLTETLKACKTALILGGFTAAIYIPLGTLFGVLAGYFRRRVDDAIQYLYSTLASIPEILLLIAIIFVLGQSLTSMCIALGVTGWVGLCRLIRGETLRQAERPYVAAARSIGQSHWKIITRHLLPNVMHLVVINFVLGFSGIVLTEAVLSYLGVGTPVGTASWGNMIDGARSELSRDPIVWWNLVSAATALFGLVLALNLLGDALRRAFDPKQG